MKNVYILELTLLSKVEKKANKFTFSTGINVILGQNETGKSSLIKSIYNTFGANTQFNSKFKNANCISSVKFNIGDDIYTIVRDDKRFGLFDFKQELIGSYDSITNELAPVLGKLFSFTPLFQNRNNDFIIPPPAYMLLPFYIDQDNSWNLSWNSFTNLSQISKHRENCIYYHSGLRPNEFYELKKQKEILAIDNEEHAKELTFTKKLISNINDKISQTNFNIDINEFQNEINDLLLELEILKTKEDELKNDLHKLYHLKSSLEIQKKIASAAILESNKDFSFALEKLPDIVDCPTCGAEYDNNYLERFEIAEDEQKCKELLISINKDYNNILTEIDKTISKHTLHASEIERLNSILESKKGEVLLKDVIESSGKNHVRTIFKEKYDEIFSEISKNSKLIDEIDDKLKNLENKERRQEIISFFRFKILTFLKKLDVNSINVEKLNKLIVKIENLETGSSKSRALIAYYYAFFHLMKKYSKMAYFPIVIDSPNQQDQDKKHIEDILNFVLNNNPEDSQLILGIAETYGVQMEGNLIKLEEKYSLLKADKYDDINNEMSIYLEKIWI